MTTETTTKSKAVKAPKYSVGQKVMRILQSGRYGGTDYTPYTIVRVLNEVRAGKYGAADRVVQKLSIEGEGERKYMAVVRASRADVLTLEEYEYVRPEHEARLAKRAARDDLTQRRKVAFIQECFKHVTGLSVSDDEATELLNRFKVTDAESTCIECGQGTSKYSARDERRHYSRDESHKPVVVTELHPELADPQS